MNIIAGRVARDEGEISTNLDFKSQVSMMPQSDILIDDLKVKETVELKCLMNGMKGFNVDSFLDGSICAVRPMFSCRRCRAVRKGVCRFF